MAPRWWFARVHRKRDRGSVDGHNPAGPQGAIANALASFVGSYPWFFAFNLAMRWLPAATPGDLLAKLLRSAAAGVMSMRIQRRMVLPSIAVSSGTASFSTPASSSVVSFIFICRSRSMPSSLAPHRVVI